MALVEVFEASARSNAAGQADCSRRALTEPTTRKPNPRRANRTRRLITTRPRLMRPRAASRGLACQPLRRARRPLLVIPVGPVVLDEAT